MKLWLEFGATIVPWNLLCLKTRTCNFWRLPNHKGKVSLSSFLPNSITSRNLQLANDFGNWPFNWLSLKLIIFILQFFESACGIGPSRWLPRKFKTDKLALSCWAIQTGIFPLMLFMDRSKKIIELALQISLGITPFSLLLEIW